MTDKWANWRKKFPCKDCSKAATGLGGLWTCNCPYCQDLGFRKLTLTNSYRFNITIWYEAGGGPWDWSVSNDQRMIIAQGENIETAEEAALAAWEYIQSQPELARQDWPPLFAEDVQEAIAPTPDDLDAEGRIVWAFINLKEPVQVSLRADADCTDCRGTGGVGLGGLQNCETCDGTGMFTAVVEIRKPMVKWEIWVEYSRSADLWTWETLQYRKGEGAEGKTVDIKDTWRDSWVKTVDSERVHGTTSIYSALYEGIESWIGWFYEGDKDALWDLLQQKAQGGQSLTEEVVAGDRITLGGVTWFVETECEFCNGNPNPGLGAIVSCEHCEGSGFSFISSYPGGHFYLEVTQAITFPNNNYDAPPDRWKWTAYNTNDKGSAVTYAKGPCWVHSLEDAVQEAVAEWRLQRDPEDDLHIPYPPGWVSEKGPWRRLDEGIPKTSVREETSPAPKRSIESMVEKAGGWEKRMPCKGCGGSGRVGLGAISTCEMCGGNGSTEMKCNIPLLSGQHLRVWVWKPAHQWGPDEWWCGKFEHTGYNKHGSAIALHNTQAMTYENLIERLDKWLARMKSIKPLHESAEPEALQEVQHAFDNPRWTTDCRECDGKRRVGLGGLTDCSSCGGTGLLAKVFYLPNRGSSLQPDVVELRIMRDRHSRPAVRWRWTIVSHDKWVENDTFESDGIVGSLEEAVKEMAQWWARNRDRFPPSETVTESVEALPEGWTVYRKCERCHGTGKGGLGNMSACQPCNGTGVEYVQKSMHQGIVVLYVYHFDGDPDNPWMGCAFEFDNEGKPSAPFWASHSKQIFYDDIFEAMADTERHAERLAKKYNIIESAGEGIPEGKIRLGQTFRCEGHTWECSDICRECEGAGTIGLGAMRTCSNCEGLRFLFARGYLRGGLIEVQVPVAYPSSMSDLARNDQPPLWGWRAWRTVPGQHGRREIRGGVIAKADYKFEKIEDAIRDVVRHFGEFPRLHEGLAIPPSARPAEFVVKSHKEYQEAYNHICKMCLNTEGVNRNSEDIADHLCVRCRQNIIETDEQLPDGIMVYDGEYFRCTPKICGNCVGAGRFDHDEGMGTGKDCWNCYGTGHEIVALDKIPTIMGDEFEAKRGFGYRPTGDPENPWTVADDQGFEPNDPTLQIEGRELRPDDPQVIKVPWNNKDIYFEILPWSCKQCNGLGEIILNVERPCQWCDSSGYDRRPYELVETIMGNELVSMAACQECGMWPDNGGEHGWCDWCEIENSGGFWNDEEFEGDEEDEA